MTVLQFLSEISWPLVALIGIMILGPGGVLKSIVRDLADRILEVNDAVSSFKETASEFSNSQKALTASTQWVSEFQPQLDNMINQLETIRDLAAAKAISDGNKSLGGEEGNDPGVPVDSEIALNPDDMFSKMIEAWNGLTTIIRDQIGVDTFDGRSIGQMAWRLTDGRRNRPLSTADAELVENLHSQWKRFTRLYSSRDEWLSHEVFSGFIRGAERAESALKERVA